MSYPTDRLTAIRQQVEAISERATWDASIASCALARASRADRDQLLRAVPFLVDEIERLRKALREVEREAAPHLVLQNGPSEMAGRMDNVQEIVRAALAALDTGDANA